CAIETSRKTVGRLERPTVQRNGSGGRSVERTRRRGGAVDRSVGRGRGIRRKCRAVRVWSAGRFGPRETRENLGGPLRTARVPRIEPERAHAGEEPERGADSLGLGLAQGARGVAVGLELLALAQSGEIALAGRERGTGVPVA